jgi:hypothetical protein
MALSAFHRDVLRTLAAERLRHAESYIAGGVALSVAMDTARLSRDIDLFHDTEDAVARSWERDRRLLSERGYRIQVVRERAGFVEAIVSARDESLLMEWARDSAFRFFPFVEDADLGLVLHPFDVATNKVFALVGRLEARDWVGVLTCDAQLQPLGYLAWAAAGKDPGFTPHGILVVARRTARYSDLETSALAFDGPPPQASELSRRWHVAVADAERVVDQLPAADIGRAVLTADADLYRGSPAELSTALEQGDLQFHGGRIGGAWPRVTGRPDGGLLP